MVNNLYPCPPKAEVVGSNPTGCANFIFKNQWLQCSADVGGRQPAPFFWPIHSSSRCFFGGQP